MPRKQVITLDGLMQKATEQHARLSKITEQYNATVDQAKLLQAVQRDLVPGMIVQVGNDNCSIMIELTSLIEKVKMFRVVRKVDEPTEAYIDRVYDYEITGAEGYDPESGTIVRASATGTDYDES